MSHENVETVRSAYRSWSQGERAEFFAALDPETELVVPEYGMNPGAHRGPDGVRRFFENYLDSFEDVQFVPEAFFTSGDEVVAFVRMTGRGRGSGAEVDVSPAHVWTLGGGKVRRIEVFPNRDRPAVLEARKLDDTDAV